MKRDMELVRQILLDIENGKVTFQTEAISPDGKMMEDIDETNAIHKVRHHITIMSKANLINIYSMTYSEAHIEGLTWEGHDFADTLRDPEIWKKTKSAAATVGGVSFKALVEIGKGYAKQELQRLGIPIG